MAKWHINPQTGMAGECRAQTSCPFGGAEDHYGSREDALQAYEDQMQGDLFAPEPLSYPVPAFRDFTKRSPLPSLPPVQDEPFSYDPIPTYAPEDSYSTEEIPRIAPPSTPLSPAQEERKRLTLRRGATLAAAAAGFLVAGPWGAGLAGYAMNTYMKNNPHAGDAARGALQRASEVWREQGGKRPKLSAAKVAAGSAVLGVVSGGSVPLLVMGGLAGYGAYRISRKTVHHTRSGAQKLRTSWRGASPRKRALIIGAGAVPLATVHPLLSLGAVAFAAHRRGGGRRPGYTPAHSAARR